MCWRRVVLLLVGAAAGIATVIAVSIWQRPGFHSSAAGRTAKVVVEVQKVVDLRASDPSAAQKRLSRLAQRVEDDKTLCEDVLALWVLETDPGRLDVLTSLVSYPMFPFQVMGWGAAMGRIVLAGAPVEKLPFAIRHSGADGHPAPGVTAKLVEYASHPSVDVRAAAVVALASGPAVEHRQLLARICREDSEPSVRAKALRGIRRREDLALFRSTIEDVLAKDADYGVRIVAVSLLSNGASLGQAIGLDAPSASEQKWLWKTLTRTAEHDDDAEVRDKALRAIAALWGSKALPALEYALDHEVDTRVLQNLDVIVRAHRKGQGGLQATFEWSASLPHFNDSPLQPYADIDDTMTWGNARYERD